MGEPNSSELILEKIQNLHECLDKLEHSFDSFKIGQGQRMEDHQTRIVKIETSLALLEKACWILFTSTMAVVIASFWKLVLRP